uniref:Cytochrome P450 26 n=1 Tax=Streltzoviella insularis TaxID=1206366 RepID=A0A7D5UMU2_9NEOP|nr:cytochrome P450 26 [Streltzoviella insularis]
MQTTKLSLLIKLAANNRNIVRTVVSSNSVTVNVSDQLKPLTQIPGPSSFPIINQLHHFLPGGSLYKIDGFELLEKFYKEYGPIVRLDGIIGGTPALVIIFDAESAAQVLRSENWMPIRPGFHSLEYYRKHHNKSREDSLKPTGLITDHGDNWKQFRSKVNPIMMQPKTIKLYSSALDEVALDMIARMRSIRNDKNILEGKFDIEMNLWALESISVMALGGRIGCLDPNLAEDSPERKLIQCVHDIFKVSDELDFKPSLWRYFPTKTFKRAMNLYDEQQKLAKHFVDKAVKELKTKSKSDEEDSVLEKLLAVDEEIAYIMASDMLFAGVDTAANTIIATLYLLATNQEKQNKLREEVTSTHDKRSYLKACIKESLRMMPVVSGNLRQTTKEYNILGYRIPKDHYLTFAHSYLSMMESEFPRPTEFIPERWIAEKDDPLYYGKAHPFAFSPFGFGARSCIGRRIAELEVETFLARVIENFQVEWFGPPPKITPASLNYITGPFNFIFKDV